MTIPAFTVYSNRPRLWFRDTDKATLQARIADAAGWKTTWDTTIISAANNYRGRTDSQLVQISNPHNRLAVLALAGYLTETGRPGGGYKDRAISAAVYLSGLSDTVAPTNKRKRSLALTVVFDLLYADMTSSERNTIAAEMIQQADRMTFSTQEYLDGLTGNDQMCQLAAALTGYGHGTSDWSARLNEAFLYFYGADATGGRTRTPRYFCQDGGALKGGWYIYLGWWADIWSALMITNGTDYDAWTEETPWLSKIWEWITWTGCTGGNPFDTEPQGDMARLTAPKFHLEMHWALSLLAQKFPTPGGTEGGKHLRWLYDKWRAEDSAYADDLIWDIMFLDLAAVAPVAPEAAAAPIATSRLFSPPGIYYLRRVARGSGDDPWDYDQSVVFRFSGRKWYDLGHRHLDSGSLYLSFKGDRVLLAPSGLYDAYASTHHLNAYQRSWTQSLTPLVLDPAATYSFYGTSVVNDGGQQYKKFSGRSDPYHIQFMLNDGGGLAWIRSENFRKVNEDSIAIHLALDFAEAYKREYTDPARLTTCRTSILFIEPTAANGLTWTAALIYIRLVKADPSFRTIIPFQFAKAFTQTAYGGHAEGYQGVGKLWLDIRDIGSYTRTVQGPGSPLDALGFGPDQFKVPFGGTTNYKPGTAPNSREVPDIKTYSLLVEKTTRAAEERYVFLLMPTAAGDPEPVSGRTWVSDGAQPDWYGITLGTETYMLHRTQISATYGAPDTTPPGEVSGFTLSPRESALLARWTDPGDADLEKIILKYRTSAIP